jgi:hypothetical protein
MATACHLRGFTDHLWLDSEASMPAECAFEQIADPLEGCVGPSRFIVSVLVMSSGRGGTYR